VAKDRRTGETKTNSNLSADSGIIMKSDSGFYYVKISDGSIVQCRARGKFRSENISPLTGDFVDISYSDLKNGAVEKIHERVSFFRRPPVANIKKLIIISSVKEPEPNLFVIDKLSALAESKNVEPVIVFSKCDLADAGSFVKIYENAGIVSFEVSAEKNVNVDKFASLFGDGVCALTGNTGVGKSSLLNAVDPDFKIPTNEISYKLNRGRHTTRRVSLYEFHGGYIADTPGFSSLEKEGGEIIPKEELPYSFPEFRQYLGKCRFTSCSHTGENGCAVCEAVKKGEIAESRYSSYKRIYDSVKDIKDWNMR
jgi:ribosome biogenesis GTPase